MPIAKNALWVSKEGKPLTAQGISFCVRTVTKRELGKSVSAHLFRKIASTELAILDPEHVRIAQPLLGHADYQTTQRAYNLSRLVDAARRNQGVIQSIRTGHPGGRGASATPVRSRKLT